VTALSARRGGAQAVGSSPIAWAARLLFIAALLGVWHLAAGSPLLRDFLPTPFVTVLALGRMLTDGGLWLDLGLTLRSALTGLAIAASFGIVLGLLIGASRFLHRSTAFTIDFLRTVPGLALIPLGILVFGPTMSLAVFMIVFAALWPILIQSISAARNLDRAIIEMATVYRIPLLRRLFQVLLPACLPSIAAGLRLAAVLAVLLAVGTELLTGAPGLGSRIAFYQETSNYGPMYACVIIAGFFGVAFNALVRLVERRALRWYHVPRELARRAG